MKWTSFNCFDINKRHPKCECRQTGKRDYVEKKDDIIEKTNNAILDSGLLLLCDLHAINHFRRRQYFLFFSEHFHNIQQWTTEQFRRFDNVLTFLSDWVFVLMIATKIGFQHKLNRLGSQSKFPVCIEK